jgi:hypothetical protein
MSKSEQGDPRLANRKTPDDNRQDRGAEDRPATENRALSDDERLEIFRNTSFQHTLPELPSIKGFHVCWLTTQNPRDSIATRTRWGYEPVKSSDIPGWDHTTMKTGDYAGCIGINEMVAFKIPLNLYEMYMKEAHHDGPLKEERKLSAVLEVIAQQARDHGAQVEMGDGSASLGRAPRRPIFEEL